MNEGAGVVIGYCCPRRQLVRMLSIIIYDE
jgi:hypothetical protein